MPVGPYRMETIGAMVGAHVAVGAFLSVRPLCADEI